MIRRKYRWLMFEVLGAKVSKGELLGALLNKAMALFGLFGYPEFTLVDFDEEKQVGIIRCAREDLDKMRVLLACLRNIKKKRVVIIDVYCSGTLKKLKEKTLNRKSLRRWWIWDEDV